ncbi:MAG: cytochrome c-type biogenesis protein CcmH [Legionellales bacterium]|nr:cytochrome c-type biogenesis protein CcmH [Legionellales bacterium]
MKKILVNLKSLSIILLLIGLIMMSPSFAASDIYPFQHPNDQQRFHYLLTQFRCLVCQNEDLADSNAKLAADLRQQIYQMVKQHHSNETIRQYLVDRYGDFVLYKPPLQENTYALWFAPLIFFAVGMFMGWLIWKKRQRMQR